jgi:hypothetical protein
MSASEAEKIPDWKEVPIASKSSHCFKKFPLCSSKSPHYFKKFPFLQKVPIMYSKSSYYFKKFPSFFLSGKIFKVKKASFFRKTLQAYPRVTDFCRNV